MTDKRREGLPSRNTDIADNGNQQQYARSRLSFVKLGMPAQLLHVTQIQTAAANSTGTAGSTSQHQNACSGFNLVGEDRGMPTNATAQLLHVTQLQTAPANRSTHAAAALVRRSDAEHARPSCCYCRRCPASEGRPPQNTGSAGRGRGASEEATTEVAAATAALLLGTLLRTELTQRVCFPATWVGGRSM